MTTPTAAGTVEVMGLVTAQAYAIGMREALIRAASGATAFSAGLDRHEVAGPAVAAVDRAQDLTTQAGAAWAAAVAALDRQTTVREAYAAAPEAGSREFVADAAGGGLTMGEIGAGLIEFASMDDGAVSRLKEHHRSALSALLGEEIPDRPLHKAEFIALLERARARLSAQQT